MWLSLHLTVQYLWSHTIARNRKLVEAIPGGRGWRKSSQLCCSPSAKPSFWSEKWGRERVDGDSYTYGGMHMVPVHSYCMAASCHTASNKHENISNRYAGCQQERWLQKAVFLHCVISLTGFRNLDFFIFWNNFSSAGTLLMKRGTEAMTVEKVSMWTVAGMFREKCVVTRASAPSCFTQRQKSYLSSCNSLHPAQNLTQNRWTKSNSRRSMQLSVAGKVYNIQQHKVV